MIASKRLQYATNLNTGIASTISGSDTALNNGVLRSVSGLAFSNSTVRSFNMTVTVSVERSAGGNLFETFTLEGNQTASSWDLIVSSVGDNTQTTFSITSAGQIQHTTGVFANWTSTTLRYSGNQIVASGSMIVLSSNTLGSQMISNAVITSQSAGSSVITNATVANAIITAQTVANSNISNATIANATVTGTLTGANLAMASVTAGNLRVPGTLTVTNITVNNVVQSSGTIVVTGNQNTIGSLTMDTSGNINISGAISRSAPTMFMTISADQSIPSGTTMSINWNSTIAGSLSNMGLSHSNGTFTYNGTTPITIYINFGAWLSSLSAAGLFVALVYTQGVITFRFHQYVAIGGVSLFGNTVLTLSNGSTFSIGISPPAGVSANVNSSGSSYTWLRITQI